MVRPDLDRLPSPQIVELLLDAEARVNAVLRAEADALASGAERMARCVRAGGRLVFAGAGTSGRIAVAEAAELPGTFGLERQRVLGYVAGGAASTDDDEDDLAGARQDLDAIDFGPHDVLVAVAASGSTPYTMVLARGARAARASVIAVVNRRDSPLAALADVAIEVITGDEVLRGSTRLTAGTAQKIALNVLSTVAMARAGRVHGDLMIDVVGANDKLRQRAAGIVGEIAGCSADDARLALEQCGGNARAAVVLLSGGGTPADAVVTAARYPSLREALSRSDNSGDEFGKRS